MATRSSSSSVSRPGAEPRLELSIEERGEAGRIARLVVDYHGKLNILTRRLIDDFAEKVDRLAGDGELRALVLTGAGERAFIGGADIRELAALDGAGAAPFIDALHRACDALRRLPVPVIARVHGYALGAGLEVAAACDLRIASEHARFGMPEVKVGIPSVIEAALLPSLIGWGRTRRLLLTGEIIDAHTAERWGLVEWCVPAAQLDAAVSELLDAILACGAKAIRLQKTLVREWEELPMSQAIARGIASFADAFASDEPQRMMGDFLAKAAARRKARSR
ncbi:MAG TPA: enoyl-CoA hydratase [Stellaceae bacterium]|nr:enoyl-CoA hydratase [Stellaceae bacterium]